MCGNNLEPCFSIIFYLLSNTLSKQNLDESTVAHLLVCYASVLGVGTPSQRAHTHRGLLMSPSRARLLQWDTITRQTFSALH